MSCRTIRMAAAVAVALTSGLSAQSVPADFTPPAIPSEKFERLHRMLVPTSDDLAGFWDLPWEINIHAARVKAAAQDKPILGYLGANGSSLGAT